MSEVAGRMAIQVGAHYLEKDDGDAAFCSVACPACPRRVSDHRRRRVGTNAAKIAWAWART